MTSQERIDIFRVEVEEIMNEHLTENSYRSETIDKLVALHKKYENELLQAIANDILGK